MIGHWWDPGPESKHSPRYTSDLGAYCARCHSWGSEIHLLKKLALIANQWHFETIYPPRTDLSTQQNCSTFGMRSAIHDSSPNFAHFFLPFLKCRQNRCSSRICFSLQLVWFLALNWQEQRSFGPAFPPFDSTWCYFWLSAGYSDQQINSNFDFSFDLRLNSNRWSFLLKIDFPQIYESLSLNSSPVMFVRCELEQTPSFLKKSACQNFQSCNREFPRLDCCKFSQFCFHGLQYFCSQFCRSIFD